MDRFAGLSPDRGGPLVLLSATVAALSRWGNWSPRLETYSGQKGERSVERKDLHHLGWVARLEDKLNQAYDPSTGLREWR